MSLSKDFLSKLNELIPEDRILLNEPMKDHTTFKVGGPAGALVTVYKVKELQELLALLKATGTDFFILGNGSNLLVSDRGYEGVAVKLSGKFDSSSVEDGVLGAGGGALLSRVCSLAQSEGLSGLEFAYGIPGTVGGAIVMNAGAYGGEMAGVVDRVTLMDYNGEIVTLSSEQMVFDYRDSILRHKQYIVLAVEFKLVPSDKDKILYAMQENLGKRKEKQPLEYPSAGSTFKRPKGHFAGKLIEEAGLSGKRVGGAAVSKKHCGFIVNNGGASGSDIDTLIKEVQEAVFLKSGVQLEPEVIRIGEFT